MIASLLVVTVVNPSAALGAAMDGATSAVTTAMSLCAVYCLWNGIFGVLEQSKLVETLSRVTKPVTKFLYGKLNETAAGYIAINMSANLIGVSNAATPSAQKAIEIMEKDNTSLSRAGAMLFVVNATSIQLIPSTVMGLRASMGSLSPSDIILPTFISTAVTTVLGVLLVNLAYGRAKR